MLATALSSDGETDATDATDAVADGDIGEADEAAASEAATLAADTPGSMDALGELDAAGYCEDCSDPDGAAATLMLGKPTDEGALPTTSTLRPVIAAIAAELEALAGDSVDSSEDAVELLTVVTVCVTVDVDTSCTSAAASLAVVLFGLKTSVTFLAGYCLLLNEVEFAPAEGVGNAASLVAATTTPIDADDEAEGEAEDGASISSALAFCPAEYIGLTSLVV